MARSDMRYFPQAEEPKIWSAAQVMGHQIYWRFCMLHPRQRLHSWSCSGRLTSYSGLFWLSWLPATLMPPRRAAWLCGCERRSIWKAGLNLNAIKARDGNLSSVTPYQSISVEVDNCPWKCFLPKSYLLLLSMVYAHQQSCWSCCLLLFLNTQSSLPCT